MRKDLWSTFRVLIFSFTISLTKACLTAKLLHEQQKEIAQYERSKKIVRDRNLKFDQCPQVMKKISKWINSSECCISSLTDLYRLGLEIETKQAVAKDTKAQ